MLRDELLDGEDTLVVIYDPGHTSYENKLHPGAPRNKRACALDGGEMRDFFFFIRGNCF